jgi:RNA processing factor Prp31
LLPYRALKTKHETPKYGLIYHASLIGQSQPKFKGKISRVLAAKCALAIRVDALGDTTDAAVGTEARAKVRLAILLHYVQLAVWLLGVCACSRYLFGRIYTC